MTAPKVSVSLITYNQEAFVAEAIEGAVRQQTTFDYEIVIGEDCSTDRTREIVRQYAERFPKRIRLVLHDSNLGLLKNFLRTFQVCRGEYVALLDGDDYWTNPLKLEKQARFLDGHPECSISFHDVAVRLPDGRFCEANYTHPDQPAISSVQDLLLTNFIATCSAMLRRAAVPDLPAWYTSSPWEDWPLYILYAEQGKIGYSQEVMGVYRNHGRGLWSALDPVTQLERVIDFLRAMDARLGYRYTDRIRSSIAGYTERVDRARESAAAMNCP